MSRIVITGAAGYLGSALARVLASDFEVFGLDLAPLPEGLVGRQVDLGDYDAVREAFEGADQVINCASIHPWKPYTDEQYIQLNIQGTWNVLKAASAAGVKQIVHTSSIAVTGYEPGPEGCPVREAAAIQAPLDMYSVTKATQEHICATWHRASGVPIAMLRPPAFFPTPPAESIANLLAARLLLPDLVAAHVAAAKTELSGIEAYYTTGWVPYAPEDAVELRENPQAVVERYWPGAVAKLASLGASVPSVGLWWDISKAERAFGWRPRLTFEVALEEALDA